MQRKILSLILSGVLLLQISCFSTFTISTYGFTVGQRPFERDVCKNYPRNQYNQTVNINCAFMQLVNEQRVSNGMSSGIFPKIGPNGDHEIRFWHVRQLKTFATELYNLILSRNKEALKYEYIKSLSETTKKFLSLDSAEEADKVTKKLLSRFPYFRNSGITANEVKEWGKSLSERTITSNEVEDWKDKHAEFVDDYKNEKCNWLERTSLVEKLFSICGNKVDNEIRKIFGRKAREQEIMANVYSSLINQAVHSSANGDYEGQDTLVAQLDFSDDNYNAKVYFENIGLGEEKKIQHQDVKPFLDYYSGNNQETDSNQKGKEEL